MSARWAITPGTSLQATVNPDFSQVEADAAQLDVNTRFALFFPEKRPFFLEGADFFETQFPLVFTRTVADPVAGLKVTGKQDAHAFGAFFAQDRINNLILPESQRSRLTRPKALPRDSPHEDSPSERRERKGTYNLTGARVALLRASVP